MSYMSSSYRTRFDKRKRIVQDDTGYTTSERASTTPSASIVDDVVLMEQRLNSVKGELRTEITTVADNLTAVNTRLGYYMERALVGSQQSMGTATKTAVVFNTELASTFPAGRLTLNTPNVSTFTNSSGGTMYLYVSVSLKEASGTNSNWRSYIQRTGSNQFYGYTRNINGQAALMYGVHMSTVLKLAAGESFSVYTHPIGGAALTLGSSTGTAYEEQPTIVIKEI